LIAALALADALIVTCAAIAQETAQTPGVRLSNLHFFAPVRDTKGDSDVLLGRALSRTRPAEDTAPSVDFGRFHASLGGISGRHMQLGSYRLDTSEFLNSSISGSIDGRGARLMFTLPVQ
jgi:hypothetical protein